MALLEPVRHRGRGREVAAGVAPLRCFSATFFLQWLAGVGVERETMGTQPEEAAVHLGLVASQVSPFMVARVGVAALKQAEALEAPAVLGALRGAPLWELFLAGKGATGRLAPLGVVCWRLAARGGPMAAVGPGAAELARDSLLEAAAAADSMAVVGAAGMRAVGAAVGAPL